MSDYRAVIALSWLRGPQGTGPGESNAQWWQVHDFINGQLLQLHQGGRVIRPFDDVGTKFHTDEDQCWCHRCVDVRGLQPTATYDRTILIAGVPEEDADLIAQWVHHWLIKIVGIRGVTLTVWSYDKFDEAFPKYKILEIK